MVSLIVMAGCGRLEKQWVVVEGTAMGMRWKVQAEGIARSTLEKIMLDRCEVWEVATSHWLADSELMRFNAVPSEQWVAVSDELWSAVNLAKKVAGQTEAAIDITIGPLIDLWGVGATGRRTGVPTEPEIEQARRYCGWRFLEMDAQGKRLRKRVSGLQINVASVVEGLVLDECAGMLRRHGAVDFMVELGGELLAAGKAPRGGYWLVAVQAPGGETGEADALLPLVDAALATSGTYRQRFVVENMAFSHLLDPTTGRPVEHDLVSVTVMHESAAWADAYATALLVLGPVKGQEVASRLGLRVYWIVAHPRE